MFDRQQMIYQFREHCGGIPETMLSDRSIADVHLINGVRMVAASLNIPKRTDITQFPLQADVFEYALPSNVLQVQEVMWNSQHIPFSSIEEWRRAHVNWRTAPAGRPQEVAIDGRQLILLPGPSADTIAADPVLLLRYTATEFRITPEGVPGFGDADVMLAIEMAALRWMMTANAGGRYTVQIQGLQAIVDADLPMLKERYSRMIADYQPGTEAPPRMSAAR
jgi:hypothetical protein